MSKVIFEWTGRQISLNTWYESKHWSERQNAMKDWHEFFGTLILMQRSKIPKPCECYEITLIYKSNIDPSNTIAMVKLFEDSLQKMDIIKGDDKRYCKGIHLVPDTKFKHRQYKLECEFF